MSVRTPILLALFLVAAVVAIAAPASAPGLLLLTPALAVLLPLLFSFYPGEKSVARLASWVARIRIPERSGSAFLALAFDSPAPAWVGFSSATGSRGPPLLSV
jgi:hypothetical protein